MTPKFPELTKEVGLVKIRIFMVMGSGREDGACLPETALPCSDRRFSNTRRNFRRAAAAGVVAEFEAGVSRRLVP
jgi:hypothetical protein